MEIVFVSCCHLCGEATEHPLGREGRTLSAFYEKHRECLKEYAGNAETREKHCQGESWMNSEQSGGYKKVMLFGEKWMSESEYSERLKWRTGVTVTRELPSGSNNSRREIVASVKEEARKTDERIMRVGTRVGLAIVNPHGTAVKFLLMPNEKEYRTFAIGQQFVFDQPDNHWKGVIWLRRDNGIPYRVEYERRSGTEQKWKKSMQGLIGDGFRVRKIKEGGPWGKQEVIVIGREE